MNLAKKYYIKLSTIFQKSGIEIDKSKALDLDAYIQHRVDESINETADGEQIIYTDGTITNTVNTNNTISHWLVSSVTSTSTSNTLSQMLAANTSNTNGVANSGLYYITATNSGVTTPKQITVTNYVSLTESSATPFLTLSANQNAGSIGGIIVYTIFATDGTHMQSKSGRILYDAILKDSSGTMTITDTQNTTCASSGTLTATLSAAYNSPYFEFRCSAASSLTQTSLYIKYHLIGN